MEEEEFDINALYDKRMENPTLSNPNEVDGVVGYNTGIGKSKYDENFLAHLHDSDTKFDRALQTHRAKMQPTSHKAGNALARLVNIVPEAIGSIGSALDFEDYFNQDQEVGNWLTSATEAVKKDVNEAFPIYRENPGKALDYGDVGWWFENGSSLVQSIGGFAVSGGVITKGLQGLSRVSKVRKLAQTMQGINKGDRLVDGAIGTMTAIGLNQSESILEATSVYDDIYKETLHALQQNNDRDAESKARQKAADAASATINANRINILLNLSSASMFLKNPRVTSKLLTKENLKKSMMVGGTEGLQESAEEMINFISGEYGRAVGRNKKYGFQQVMDDLGKPEAMEAALLGFFGGLGQTIITKEGVNRFSNAIDPETGEKLSVRDYNNRAYEAQKLILDEYDANAKATGVKNFTDAFNDTVEHMELNKAYEEAVTKGDEVEAEKLGNLTLSAQSYRAFRNGTTDSLVELYENMIAGPQKEGMGEDYKIKATEAVTKIRTLEKFYNESEKYINHQQVYLNRAYGYDLKNNYKKLNEEVGDATNSLGELTSVMLEGTTFDPQGQGIYGYTLDGMTGDFTNEGSTLTKSYKKALKEYKDLRETIKNTPEYIILEALRDAKDQVKKDLDRNLRNYKRITSPKYRAAYKKRQEAARSKAKEELDKQVKQAEKEAADDKKVAEKQARDAKVQDIQNRTKAKVNEAKTAVDEANGNLSNMSDQFNEGETTALDSLGEEFAGEVGTVTKVEENPDGTKTVEITTENGDVITAGDNISPRYKNHNVEPITITEGSETTNTSNDQLSESSTNNDSKSDTKKNSNALSDVKMMSTYKDSGKTIPGVPKAFIDYERNGIDKKGTKVTFEISNDFSNAGNKTADFKKAVSLLNDIKKGKELSKNDKNFIVDNLPVKLKINDSSEIFTYLMSKPNTTNNVALQAYNNRSRNMRVNLVKALIDGNDINVLSTTIKGQYGGSLNMDEIYANNNPLELDYIDGDISKVEVGVLDEMGNLIDRQGNFIKGWNPSKIKDNWKGSTYLKIKKANGQDFHLNLNFGKITTTQADSIFDIYKDLLTGNVYAKSNIMQLSPNTVKSVLKHLKPELDMIVKVSNKSIEDITVSNLLDVLFWDGSESTKSKLKFNFGNETVEFGNISYGKDEFTDDKREEFVEWVSKNKNRNFRFKNRVNDQDNKIVSSNPDYLEYVFNSGVLTTNTKVNEPSFIGFTNLFMNNSVSGIKTVKAKPKVTKKPAPKATNITDDAFNKFKDLNMSFSTVNGKSYHASIQSGRVFEDTGFVPKPGSFATPEQQMGALVKDNALIAQIEDAVRNNPFIPNPTATLKRYNAKSTTKVEKKEEKTLKSQEKVVSLQENEMVEDTPSVVRAPRKKRVKKSRSERMKQAKARKNNDLNDKC